MPITIALRRMAEHRAVTGAAAAAVLLASVTFALLTATTASVGDAGTREALRTAPAGSTSVYFTAVASADSDAATRPIGRVARRVLAPYPVRVVHADLSAPLTATGPRGDALVRIVGADDAAAHVRAVAGVLTVSSPADVLLPLSVADRLGVTAGADVRLGNPAAPGGHPRSFHIAGVYQASDADPAFWGALTPAVDIVEGAPPAVVFGAPGLLRPPPGGGISPDPIAYAARTVWNAQPDLTAATADGLAAVADRYAALSRGRIDQAVFPAGNPPVAGLAPASQIIDQITRIRLAETAGLSGLLIVAALLAVLAALAVALTLRLVREHLGDETFLLRARGAGPRHAATVAAVEALLLVLPALLVTPFATGPLAGVLRRSPAFAGLPEVARPVRAGVLVSVLIAAFCVAVQVAAAVHDARERHVRRGRRSRRTAAFQRAGVDVALGMLALTGCLQLRHYSSPLIGGSGGPAVDPVLVLAPAVTAAALAALALRLLPAAAALAERRVGAGRGFGAALGLWQVSRRAARHAGTVLLLVLALAVGALTVTEAAMRAGSARDRAVYEIGADVRVGADSSVPPELQHSAYAAVPGVRGVTAIRSGDLAMDAGTASVIGVNPQQARGVLQLRDDIGGAELPALLDRLVYRPEQPLPAIPGRPAALRFRLTATDVPRGADLLVTLLDADGTPIRRAVPLPARSGAAQDTTVSLVPPGDPGAALAYPIRIASFTVSYPQPVAHHETGLVLSSLTAVDAAGTTTGVPVPDDPVWNDLTIGDDPELRTAMPDYCGTPPKPDAPAGQPAPNRGTRASLCRISHTGDTLTLTFASGFAPADPGPAAGPPAQTTLVVTSDPTSYDLPTIAVVATDHLLASSGLTVGRQFSASVDGVRLQLSVVGRIATLPGLGPGADGVLADWNALRAAAGSRLDGAGPPTWLLDVTPGGDAGVAAAFGRHPELGTPTLRAELAAGYRDGAFAGGVAALLAVSAWAAPVFAAIGFTVSAVIVLRGRRREFGVLRALGARPRQLAAALWLEQAVLAAVAVLVGVLIGIGTAAWTVPLVTVDEAGAPVYPAVALSVPWARSILTAAATALAVVAVVLAAARVLARVDLARIIRTGEEQQ